MNGIILYGSRYGAARQYAQALKERTGLPAVSYAEVRDFGPFDTIVYVGGLYAGKTTGLAKTARRLPTDHPFRLLVATVGLADPANEDNLLSIRESLAKELSPGIFVRTAHVPLRGHRLPGAEHQAPADDEGALRHSPPPTRDRTHRRHPGPAGQLWKRRQFYRL